MMSSENQVIVFFFFFLSNGLRLEVFNLLSYAYEIYVFYYSFVCLFHYF